MVPVHFTIYWRGEELFSIGITRDTAPESVAIGDVSSMYLPVPDSLTEQHEEEWEEEARTNPEPPRRRVGF
jgi:hypothetical protein